MNEQLLKDFVATAEKYNYDWESIFSLFPELKGYDQQLLKDYAATAEKNNYDWETVNSRFPEFSSTQQPTQQPMAKEQQPVKKKEPTESSWWSVPGISESEPTETDIDYKDAFRAYSNKLLKPETKPSGKEEEPYNPNAFLEEYTTSQSPVVYNEPKTPLAYREGSYPDLKNKIAEIDSKMQTANTYDKTKLQFEKTLLQSKIKEIESSPVREYSDKSVEDMVLGKPVDITAPKFIEETLDALTPKNLSQITNTDAKNLLNYYLNDIGFKSEQSIRNYVNVTSPNGKIYTYYTLDRSPKSLNELKNFIRENTYDNAEIAKKDYLYEKENKKFRSKEEIESEVKKINDQEEIFNNEYKDFKRLQKGITDIKADLKKWEDFGEQNTPKYIQTSAYLKELEQELQGYAVSLQEKEGLLRDQDTQLKTSAGKYLQLQSEKGTFAGALYRGFMDSAANMFSNYTRMAFSKTIDFLPASSVYSEEQFDNAYRKKLLEEGIIKRLDEPLTGVMDAKRQKEISDEVDAALRDEYKKAGITGYYKGDKLENVLTINSVREGLSDFLNLPATTTKEYKERLEKEGGRITRGLLGLSGSIPAMIGPSWLRMANMYTMTTDYVMREMDNNPEFANISENEKELVAAPIGIVGAALEEIGFRGLVKGSSITTNIVRAVLGKVPPGATASQIRRTTFDVVAEMGIRGTTALVGATLSEAETGAAQQVSEYYIKDIYNDMKGKKMFDTPEMSYKLDSQYMKDVLDAAATEAVGGFVMGVPYSIGAAFERDGFQGLDDATFKIFEELAKDNTSRKFFVIDLKNKINSGQITGAQGKKIIDAYDQASGRIGSVPDEITDVNDRKIAMDLITERKRLEDKKNKTDPALSKPIQTKIDNINEQLNTLTQDAIQKQAAGEASIGKEAEGETKIPDEILSLNDDEQITFTVKTLDEIPEQFRDRAVDMGEREIQVEGREKIFGLPIGKKYTFTTGYNRGYTYSLTGKEAKDYAIQKQAASEVSLQSETGAGKEMEAGGPEAGPQAAPKQGVLSPEESERKEELTNKKNELEQKLNELQQRQKQELEALNKKENKSYADPYDILNVNEFSEDQSQRSQEAIDLANRQNKEFQDLIQERNKLQSESSKLSYSSYDFSNNQQELDNLRNSITDVYQNDRQALDEGFAIAPAALDEAVQVGGDQYVAHGMAKTSLAKAFSDLINLFSKGIDPNMGRGSLDVATLAGGAAIGTTSSGNAYMDGPFTLVANRDHQGAITDINQVGGIIVNEGMATPEVLDSLRKLFPNLIIESTSNTKLLVEQLNNKKSEQQATTEGLGTQAETATKEQETFEQKKSEIEKIVDPEQRKVAEIEFIMSNLMSGVGEAAANKIREYADRIISGKETRDQVIQGLPKSFVNGIDQLLAAQQSPTTEQQAAPVQPAEQQFTEQDRARKQELTDALAKADKRRKNVTVGETVMPKADVKAELDALNQKELSSQQPTPAPVAPTETAPVQALTPEQEADKLEQMMLAKMGTPKVEAAPVTETPTEQAPTTEVAPVTETPVTEAAPKAKSKAAKVLNFVISGIGGIGRGGFRVWKSQNYNVKEDSNEAQDNRRKQEVSELTNPTDKTRLIGRYYSVDQGDKVTYYANTNEVAFDNKFNRLTDAVNRGASVQVSVTVNKSDNVNEADIQKALLEKLTQVVEVSVDKNTFKANPQADFSGISLNEITTPVTETAPTTETAPVTEVAPTTKPKTQSPELTLEELKQQKKKLEELKKEKLNWTPRKAKLLEKVNKAIKQQESPKKTLADSFRKAKFKGPGGLQSNILGVPIAIWNMGMETIAKSIKAGSAISEAIQKGYEYVKEKYKAINFERYEKKVLIQRYSGAIEMARNPENKEDKISDAGIKIYLMKQGLTESQADALLAIKPKAEKKPISKEKIIGKPKPKKVTVNEMTALKKQIELEIKAANKGAKSVTDAIKAIVEYVNKMSNKGNLTRKDLTKILNLIPIVKDQKSLDKAANTIYDIIKNATTDIVEVSDYKVMVDQIRLEARAAREAKGDLNAKRKMLIAAIKDMVKKGKITIRQAAVLINKVNNTNLDNPVMVERLLTYAEKVFNNAEYAEKIAVANKSLKKAKENVRTKIGVSEGLTTLMNKLFNINPNLIPDDVLEAYLDLVDMMGKRQAVLTLKESAELTKDVEKILDSINDELSILDALIDIFESYDNKVLDENGKIDFAATIDKMLEKGVITASDAKIYKKYKDKVLPAETKEKKTEAQIAEEKKDLIDAIQQTKVDENALLMREERDAARSLFEAMTPSNLQSLTNAELKNLLKLLDNISNGFFPHYAIVMTQKLNAAGRSKTLNGAVTKAGKLPFTKLIANIKALFPGAKTANMIMVIESPKYVIDQVFGYFKETPIYNSVFKPLTEAFATYKNDAKKAKEKLDKAFNKVANSYLKNPVKIKMSQFKMMTYALQLEYQSNKDKGGFFYSAADYIRETIKHARGNESTMSKKDIQLLEKILQVYGIKDADGKVVDIDIDLLYNSLNNAEKDAIKTIQEVNLSIRDKAMFTSAVIRGDKMKPIDNYIHHNVLPTGITDTDLRSVSDDMNVKMMPSTRAKSLEERTKGAKPLDFNIFGATQRSANQVLMDFHLTEAVRTSRMVLNNVRKELQEKGNDKDINILDAIESSFEKVLQNTLMNTFNESTFADKTISMITKQSYRVLLASAKRWTAELISNLAYVGITNPKAYLNGITKYSKYVMSEKGPAILRNIKSGAQDRVYEDSVLSGRMIDDSMMNEGIGLSGTTSNYAIVNAMQVIHNNTTKRVQNFVATIADTLISTPDKASLRPFYFGVFAQNFKKETGQEVDFDKIADNDEAYLKKFKEAIEKSKEIADNQTMLAGGTKNPFAARQKAMSVKGASAFTQIYQSFNNFMNSFIINEYIAARTGLYAMMGNGRVNQKQGAAILAGVIARTTLYTLLVKEIGRGLMWLILGDDDEEDEEKSIIEKTGQAFAGSMTSLILGRDFGNLTRNMINYGVEKVNENYVQKMIDGKYTKDDVIAFNSLIPSSLGSRPQFSDLLINMSGAGQPFLRSAKTLYETAFADEAKKEETIKKREIYWKYTLPLEVAGYLGFVPIYKDVKAVAGEVLKEEVNAIVEEKEEKKLDKAEAYGNYKTLEEFEKNEPEKYDEYSAPGGLLYKYRESERLEEEEKNKDEPFRGLSEERFKELYPAEWKRDYGPGTAYFRSQRTPEALRKKAEEKRAKAQREVRKKQAEAKRKREEALAKRRY